MNMGAAGGVCNINVNQPKYAGSAKKADTILYDTVDNKVVGVLATEPNRTGLASVVVSGVVQLSTNEEGQQPDMYYDAGTNKCTFAATGNVHVGCVLRVVRAGTHNVSTRAKYAVTVRLAPVKIP